jgi:ABC-type polysaccharide/polyol phosphate transport system ATPase subunit
VKDTETDVVVVMEGAGKRYRRRRLRPFLLPDVWKRSDDGANGAQEDLFWAVKDVAVEIRAGESVAVIGQNGSGKSTLLSLVAGAAHPSEGRVSVRGRIAPLLDLGVGFQADMTAPENAYINASFLGLGRREIAERLPAILDFADLGEFVNVPIRHYSRGMVARLGFAVAMHVDADVFLVDEVLAVGDGGFQERCLGRIADLRAKGTTVILASHDTGAIARACDRVIWLHEGRVAEDGEAAAVLANYQAFLAGGPGPA